jgi:hypothetical protein
MNGNSNIVPRENNHRRPQNISNPTNSANRRENGNGNGNGNGDNTFNRGIVCYLCR